MKIVLAVVNKADRCVLLRQFSTSVSRCMTRLYFFLIIFKASFMETSINTDFTSDLISTSQRQSLVQKVWNVVQNLECLMCVPVVL